MRISRVQIENYRNLRNVDVELGNIVTLIGENNSGKSNFLRAISIPLSADDNGSTKRLSWYDINSAARNQYYDFLKTNRTRIINNEVKLEEFSQHIPAVKIQLFLQPDANEHYNVKDILIDERLWMGGILYRFYAKRPEELLERVKTILTERAKA